MILTLINMVVFKLIIPTWCIIQIIFGIGENNFYSIFLTNMLYIIVSLLLDLICIPIQFLSKSDKKWMSDEVDRIKNK